MTMQAMQGNWNGPTQDDFAAIERLRARHTRQVRQPAPERRAYDDEAGDHVRPAIPRAALIAGSVVAGLAAIGAAGFWATGQHAKPPIASAPSPVAATLMQSPEQAARRRLAEALRNQDFSTDFSAADETRSRSSPSSISTEDIEAFRDRAASLIGEGRISGARALLERAAQSGDAQALLSLARTYDPQALAEWKTIGVAPDEARALELYRRAAAAGSAEAARRVAEFAK